MRKILLSLFILVSCVTANSQVTVEGILQSTDTDSVKLAKLINAAADLAFDAKKECLLFLQPALKIAQSGSTPYFIVKQSETINCTGIYYQYAAKYPQALEEYRKSYELGKRYGLKPIIAKGLLNMAGIYQATGEYQKAIEQNLTALKYFEEIKDTSRMAGCLGNIGNVYVYMMQPAKAIEVLNKAVLCAMAKNDKRALANFYNSLSVAYEDNKDTLGSIRYGEKAYNVYAELGHKRGMATVATNLGQSYGNKDDYEKAIYYYNIAFKYSREIDDQYKLAVTYYGLANMYYSQKKYGTAVQQVDSCIYYYTAVGDKLGLATAVKLKSKLLFAEKDFEHAFELMNKFSVMNDSLFSANMRKEIGELQTKYETEKKENTITVLSKSDSIKSLRINNQQLAIDQNRFMLAQQRLTLADDSLSMANQQTTILQTRLEGTQKEQKIQDLNRLSVIQQLEVSRKNMVIFTITIIALLASLSGFLFYKRFRLRKEQQLQQAIFMEQDLATKAVLEAEENERKRIAGDLHDGVGQMMSAAKMNLSAMESDLSFVDPQQRTNFEKIIYLVDESCKEVRNVSHNMMPNALLKASLAGAVREFINQIDTRVLKIDLYAEGLQEKIDSNIETVLYRVIQECVNNVIKHAEATHLDISLIRDADGIAATIEDNGKGFAANERHRSEGLGLKNIQTRVGYLKGSVEWSSEHGKGTLVAIHVPFK